MSAIANRALQVQARLDEVFPTGGGYGSFHVRLNRPRKHALRVVLVSWVAHPFEDDVRAALGDLATDDVVLHRTLLWSCGRIHTDAFDAWKAHEGADHLEYPDPWGDPLGMDEKVLPEQVEDDLRAAGETLESESCTPGNHIACPTCGGGARYLPDRKTMRHQPCPDCTRLGTDRQMFPGILNLDNPEHRALYENRVTDLRTKAALAADRQRVKRDQALAQSAATATPSWKPLPSRAAGILNGIPVPTVAPGCDYLTHAEDPDRRVRCRNSAAWFDPTTGLRVCTRHKRRSAAEGPR